MRILIIGDTHYGITSPGRLDKFYFEECTGHFDIIVHVGDWACSDQSEIEAGVRQIRNWFPKTPILTVRGNHDFWSQNPHNLHDLDKFHAKIFEHYKIHHLQNNPFILKDVLFVGFDGWYGNPDPPTNDDRWIHSDIPHNVYLADKAANECQKVLSETMNAKDKTIIATTHFPPLESDCFPGDTSMIANPKWLDFLTENSNYLLCGHTHCFQDVTINGCRIINNGSDYGTPRKFILTI